MMQVKERGGSGSRFISRAVKTENPVPRSVFAPKLNGNAFFFFKRKRLPRRLHLAAL